MVPGTGCYQLAYPVLAAVQMRPGSFVHSPCMDIAALREREESIKTPVFGIPGIGGGFGWCIREFRELPTQTTTDQRTIDMNTTLVHTRTAMCAVLAFAFAGCSTMPKNEPPPAVEPVAVAPMVTPPAYVPVPEKIVIDGVNFDFDKSTLKPGARDILDHAVTVIQPSSSSRFRVSGFTDSDGSDAYNQGLSERRAKSVGDYLIEHGVLAQRLDAVGYGESRPLATNDTVEGRAQNRRVEIDAID
jgi:outer membrane protein OmpA-like peptidoglycan-associated protein